MKHESMQVQMTRSNKISSMFSIKFRVKSKQKVHKVNFASYSAQSKVSL